MRFEVNPENCLTNEEGVKKVLKVCKCNDEQAAAIMNDGFPVMKELLLLRPEDLPAMFLRLTKRPHRVVLDTAIMKRMEALLLWCRQRRRESLPLDANEFDEEVMDRLIEAADQEKDEVPTTKPDPPKGFKVLEWVTWSRKFEGYLRELQSAARVPLYYVIRKNRNEEEPYASEEERALYAVGLRGIAYKKDNTKVWRELRAILCDTPAWTWISKFEKKEDGRNAMIALRNHYDGPGEVEKRLSYAKREIENCHYRSEKVFTFERYMSKLSEAFEILAENGLPKVEREKVDILLGGMSVDNTEVTAAIANIRMNPLKRNNFSLAANELSEYISMVMPQATSEGGKRPARQVAEVNRSKKKNKTNHSKNKSDAAVDTSDVERSFTNQEWRKLSPETRKMIQEKRKQKKQNRKVSKVASKEAEKEEEPVYEGNGGHFGSGAYRNRKE